MSIPSTVSKVSGFLRNAVLPAVGPCGFTGGTSGTFDSTLPESM